MSVMVVIVGLLSLLVIKQVIAVEVFIEGENNKNVINSRSEASNQQTLQLSEDDKATYEFCLTESALVKVKNIRYSNDGGTDRIDVIVNDDTIGSFQTTGEANNGQNWNVFRSSGEVGQSQMNSGRHKLYVKVDTADQYGVEIDNIQLEVNNNDDQDTINCRYKSISIEGEAVQGQYEINSRSEASNSQVLKLSNGDVASFTFCVPATTRVVLDNIRSSNDGESDTMEVRLDDEVLGTFQSISGSNGGHNWNVFYRSGRIGTEQTLQKGEHTVTITVSADTYGVEIDVLQFSMLGTDINQNDVVNCNYNN
ncbi:hypothetical protein LOTGIDRAFT_154901 [Lottia gigantea]|uniref:CBM6 domain-containing protein n=1 Tax=Lottia gigantea TaxID=225164 RepID=V3ZSA5_LOTGI|nr:hypothetical protein LOTGIDRAFT_154901 [Lottia gigantea]ESO85405.1 hypothetical protein LOTGIDRAFT_154901 [Lottia gigantea]